MLILVDGGARLANSILKVKIQIRQRVDFSFFFFLNMAVFEPQLLIFEADFECELEYVNFQKEVGHRAP